MIRVMCGLFSELFYFILPAFSLDVCLWMVYNE